MSASVGARRGSPRCLAPLAVAYASLSAWMFWQERSMRRGGGPGIVGFELAGSARRAEEIVETWGPEGREVARRSLLIDYLVLATYAPLLAGLVRRSGVRLADADGGRAGRLAPGLARASYLAAACDLGENTALLAVLAGRRGRLPAPARAMALTKFTLLGIGIAYIAAGAAPRRWVSRRGSGPRR